MKDRIGIFKASLGLILLIALVIGAIQFRSVSSESMNVNKGSVAPSSNSPIYPPAVPEALSAQSEISNNPYPGAEDWNVSAPTNNCTKVGTWIEYVNTEASFTFQYPAEAELHESVDSNGYPNIVLFLKPDCYVDRCWGTDRLDIVVLLNNEKLSLENFIVKQFTSSASIDPLALSQELAYYSKTISVDQITAVQMNGKITQETPRVYIPSDDIVIYFGLTVMKYMPPFEQPCPTTLDLFNKIVSSIKLLPPQVR